MRRIFLLLLTLAVGSFLHALLRAEGAGQQSGEGGERGEEERGEVAPAAAPGQPCAGLTASGRPCSRQALPGSEYCWQHGG